MMEGYKTIIWTIFLLAHVTATALNNYEERKIDRNPISRLPKTIEPTYYDVSLTIDPEKSEYNGNVLLYFDVADAVSAVKEIPIHADLDFLNITKVLVNNVPIPVRIISDEVNIILDTEITGQNNILSITFTGKFSTDDEFGLVKTSYLEKGSEQILIQSNFKPIYARRAFPCLDEPNFRASFSLKMTYPEEYKVISNTPVKAESSSNGLKVTEFEKTPKISTYLFSILFSKLQEASSSPGDGYEVKIFTTPEAASMPNVIAATYSSKIIEQLSIYTGVYNKLNDSESYLVALPNYYSDVVGGYGLFTFSESELLDEGNKTSARVKQNILTDITYKLSHEWYGGDVSTKWWSDIWANEAVATYFKYIIPEQIDKELELTNQFMVEVIQKALQHDALPLAQPLSSDVRVARDIENKLDSFHYLKGASILHMTKYIIPKITQQTEDLNSALKYHWKERRDSGTDGEDLLRDLVKTIQDDDEYYPLVETWASKPGFPLLTAKLGNSSSSYQDVTQLSQKRFVYPVANPSNYDNDHWYIPLTATNQDEMNFTRTSIDGFCRPGQQTAYISESNIWQIFNLQGASFYRVNYEDQLWRRFISYLMSDERTGIEVLSRAKLVDDIFNVARIGDVSYALAFELADYLVHETEYYPWYSGLNAFSYIRGKLEEEAAEANLKKYILDLLDNEVNIPSDTAENLTHIDTLKKVMILNWACDLGHTACVEYATNKFRNFKQDQTSLEDYNYRNLVFCNGIRHTETKPEDWYFLWNVFINSASVHEKNDILHGLGCVKDKDLLISYLQKMFSTDSRINNHDAVMVFKSIFSSSLGLDVAIEFLENDYNLTRLLNYYGVDVLSKMLYTLAEKMFTDEHLEWIKELPVLYGYEDIKPKAVILVSVNNYWKNHYQSEVKDVLRGDPATTTTANGTGITTTTPSTTTASCENVYLSKFVSALALLVLTMLQLSNYV